MTRNQRLITAAEVDVVRAAVALGQPGVLTAAALARLPELIVRCACECGCASVDFEQPAPGGGSRPLVTGRGTATADGEQVGWILWGWSGAITGLEVYGFGAEPGQLPLPATMCRD